MEKRDEKVLFELAPLIEKELNITVKYALTTNEEREILLNPCLSDTEKKRRFLFLWLPSKSDNSLDRFIEALKESKEGNTHEILARRLQEKKLARGDDEGNNCIYS